MSQTLGMLECNERRRTRGATAATQYRSARSEPRQNQDEAAASYRASRLPDSACGIACRLQELADEDLVLRHRKRGVGRDNVWTESRVRREATRHNRATRGGAERLHVCTRQRQQGLLLPAGGQTASRGITRKLSHSTSRVYNPRPQAYQ